MCSGIYFSIFIHVKLSEDACYSSLEFPSQSIIHTSKPLSHSPTSLTFHTEIWLISHNMVFQHPIQENVLQKIIIYKSMSLVKMIDFFRNKFTYYLLMPYDSKIILLNIILCETSHFPSPIYITFCTRKRFLLNLVCFQFSYLPPWMCYWCSLHHLSCCPWTVKYFAHSLNMKVWTVKLWWDKETVTVWCKDRVKERRVVLCFWGDAHFGKSNSLHCSVLLCSTLRGLLLYK